MANQEDRKHPTAESPAGGTPAAGKQTDDPARAGGSAHGDNANQPPGPVQDISSKAPRSDMANQAGQPPSGGYQSPAAADQAQQLHEAETRQAAIQGSASTQDRRNQGKRDNR